MPCTVHPSRRKSRRATFRYYTNMVGRVFLEKFRVWSVCTVRPPPLSAMLVSVHAMCLRRPSVRLAPVAEGTE
jgi:hypothetical protein